MERKRGKGKKTGKLGGTWDDGKGEKASLSSFFLPRVPRALYSSSYSTRFTRFISTIKEPLRGREVLVKLVLKDFL